MSANPVQESKMEASIERVLNAIDKNKKVFMFINHNKGISVTKDLEMYDSVKKERRIGIYTAGVNPNWVKEDLEYMGYKVL
jgi:hypothetical protein